MAVKHDAGEPARYGALKLIWYVMDVPLRFIAFPHKMVAIKELIIRLYEK